MPDDLPIRMRIPDRHREAFRSLGELDDSSVEALIRALEAASPASSSSRLADSLSEQVEIPRSTLRSLVSALYSLQITAESLQVPLRAMAKQVAAEAIDEELGITADSRQTFEQRILRLLGPELALSVGARAASVVLENQRVYINGRVVSDIRPVFAAVGETLRPVSAGILHTLRIHAHSGRSGATHEDHYFTLTIDDIIDLQKQLERALDKHEVLRGIVSGTEMSYLETSEETESE